MATRQKTKFCPICRRKTLHQKEIFAGEWGCLLTLFTCGLFLPFWALADLGSWLKPYRCQVCGREA